MNALASAAYGEWTKARAVRSTWAAVGAFLLVMVGVGLAVTATADPTNLTVSERAAYHPVSQAMSGVFLGQVVLSLIGALIVTTEYTSRSITTTLLAVPRRGILLLSKTIVLVAVVLPLAILGTASALLVGLPILSSKGLGASRTGILTAALGAPLYLTLTALLGLSLGVILRSTAAAVVALTGLLFLVPVLVGLLPAADAIGQWLPAQAGQAVLVPNGTSGYLDPGAGLVVLGLYAAGLTLAALQSFRLRDAST